MKDMAEKCIVYMGAYGRAYPSVEKAMEALREVADENRLSACPWRVARVCRRFGRIQEIHLEGFYFWAAYRPRAWRCRG